MLVVKAQLAALVLLLFSVACVPTYPSFYKAQSSYGKSYGLACKPDKGWEFTNDGVSVQAAVTVDTVEFKVWVPEGSAVQLLSNELVLSGGEKYSATVAIDEFLTYGKKRNKAAIPWSSPLVGQGPGTYSVWDDATYFLFSKAIDAHQLQSLELSLPEVSINDRRYKLPAIQFRLSYKPWLGTINC